METNHTFWAEFIDIYRQQVCLWDVNSNNYLNKQKRNASYDVLLQKLKEMNPKATVEGLKKKINNMRTAFRRELKKVQCKGGEIYQPTLWYFDLLLFTCQTGRKNKSTDELEGHCKHETVHLPNKTENDEESESVHAEESLTQFFYASDSEANSNKNEDSTDTLQTPSTIITPQNKRRKTSGIEQNKQESVYLAHKAPSNNSDIEEECNIASKRIGYQLKAVEGHQRIIAEKLISDVMFYAKLGKLTEDSSICIPSDPGS
ncbi:hypothetical protein GWI33_000942 [Rhynchophorus ferrugineus]|uniref:MADF domain-containing protein n=1 Tax=Rhynchophorus ferrugineus TaxID=354439 RepID=A0A834IP53_RHYFE|nr:hypothetical protein GWI33_000942 [Rhynchophorus ferrugineus]